MNKNVRKIIEIGGALSVKGKITDNYYGAGLKGATVSFADDAISNTAKFGSCGAAKVKKSADKGGFNIKTLAEGSYTVTIVKPSYKDAAVALYVSNGALSMVAVPLEQR